MKHYKAPTTELVYYSYLIGACYIFVITIANGTFFPALEYCQSRPFSETYGAMIFYSSLAWVLFCCRPLHVDWDCSFQRAFP